MAFVLKRILSPNTLQRHIMVSSCKGLHSTSIVRTTSDANAAESSRKSDPANNKLLVSDSCIKRLREMCKDGSFLRITVEGGGCSGFQYKFELDQKLNEDDREFGEEKAKVVIDEISLEYCSGTTVDYQTELIRSGFRMIANPQAEQGCSCGSSFSIKID